MKWVVCAVVAMSVVSGCASRPQAPVTGSVTAPAAPTQVSAGSGAAPHAASGATASAATGANDAKAGGTAGKQVNRALIAQGYQPSTYRGQLYYCRKQKLTGSQFTQRVCLTEQEAALQERIAQDEMNKRNSQGKCLPPLCPNH
jgi:hypothetical protein